MQVNYTKLGLLAVGSSVWFFLTTNFAVWLAWDFYPKTLEGLITCFTLALPFFTNTLLSTVIFTGILTLAIKPMEIANEKINNFEKILNGVDLISHVEILSFDNQNVYYKIIYNGSPKNFLNDMKINQIKISTQNQIWQVQ